MWNSSVFLGGHDLEMEQIAKLLRERSDVIVHDQLLTWGARATSYEYQIRSTLAASRHGILIELIDDLPPTFPRHELTLINHHGPSAGRDTSIEQVFRLFQFPTERWTRELELVSANDRGHLAGLERVGATTAEMHDIRRRDRDAQGITPIENEQGRAAADRSRTYSGGRLTVVRLPHDRAATVTDVLDHRLGGPGYENLLVLCPKQTVFFGSGECIDTLRERYPGGWFGGELPDRGYWGNDSAIDGVVQVLEANLALSGTWPLWRHELYKRTKN